MNTTHLSIAGGIAHLIWDNPPQNRMSPGVMTGFENAIEAIKSDSSVRVVVFSANGENFSLGGDITIWPGVSPEEMAIRIQKSLARANLLEELPMPVVSAVQGKCSGGGFEYVLRSDVIIAERKATFRHPEQTLGVFTLLGGVHRVAERAGKTRAMKWALTAEEVSATEMLEAGVITEMVDNGKALERAMEWARELADGPTHAHAAHKELLRLWSAGGVPAADQGISDLTRKIFGTRDAQAGIDSAVNALAKGVERPALKFSGA
ncbi:enoyl-CoA hydratase/isomerase family protein [Alicycliphilus denitrificans]|uniref:enoyl-CoA hydratase/isomerase family protein n=1 Tax=Alicycliphilus denitrificans TaxID=179636 RepID=UPI0019160B63|nr:enoyl-CoA hydratase/isomerase family protein [Alicycliphilus denitrificans]MBN9575124.1 enoyl-CoA hydratase/isomerase family protein [Alicycliphilus denitrificans]